MKTLKKLGGFLLLMIISISMSAATGLNPLLIGGGIYTASFLPKPQGALYMALDPEIWKPWIVEQLFMNNDFLNYARNADDMVLNGKVVHIPNAGTGSAVAKNRSQLPATVVRRTDIDVTYALDEYTSDPRLIENAASILSYNKMVSAMGQDMNILKEYVASGLLYSWIPDASHVISTTGAATPTHLSGTTGNRKKLQLEDLEEAMAVMDDEDIPLDGRYALLSGRMHKQLVAQLSTSDYKDFSRTYDPAKGIVGELFGFKLMKRSKVLRATTGGTFRDPASATVAATDVDNVMCWHKDFVERAMGTVTIFERLKDPLYYGDVYSMLIRMGGRKIREDNKGVIAIQQVNV
jgi:hypothetical protein